MHDLNHAIALYVGRGPNSSTKVDASRILDHFGDVKGAELAERAIALIQEFETIEPDWKTYDFGTASKLAVEEMASRHPFLDDQGKAALHWIFYCWWK